MPERALSRMGLIGSWERVGEREGARREKRRNGSSFILRLLRQHGSRRKTKAPSLFEGPPSGLRSLGKRPEQIEAFATSQLPAAEFTQDSEVIRARDSLQRNTHTHSGGLIDSPVRLKSARIAVEFFHSLVILINSVESD